MSLSTMYPAQNNSPKTYLAADISADDTSMTLTDASMLPAGPNLLVLGINDTAEIVQYTAISGNNVTGLVRGVNGTTPAPWEADTIVARNFTAADSETFRLNILDLDSRKTDTGHTHDDRYYTRTETDTALDGKANSVHTHDDRYYTEQEMDDALALKADTASEILYFMSQTVSASASQAQIMRIPSGSGTDTAITTDTVVLECTFASPDNVTSDVSWTSYNGYITFSGICTSATTANVTLGKKGNS